MTSNQDNSKKNSLSEDHENYCNWHVGEECNCSTPKEESWEERFGNLFHKLCSELKLHNIPRELHDRLKDLTSKEITAAEERGKNWVLNSEEGARCLGELLFEIVKEAKLQTVDDILKMEVKSNQFKSIQVVKVEDITNYRESI